MRNDAYVNADVKLFNKLIKQINTKMDPAAEKPAFLLSLPTYSPLLTIRLPVFFGSKFRPDL